MDTRDAVERVHTRQEPARIAMRPDDDPAQVWAGAINRARADSVEVDTQEALPRPAWRDRVRAVNAPPQARARAGGALAGSVEEREVALADARAEATAPQRLSPLRRDRAGDPAPHASRFLHDARSAIADLEGQVDAWAPSADAVAERLTAGGGLRIEGCPGVRHELTARPGALFEWSRPGPGVTLAVGSPAVADALPRLIERARKRGDLVVGIDLPAGLEARVDYTLSVPIEQSTRDQDGAAIRPAVRLAFAHAWMGEVYAACTRRGKAPVVRLDTALDRKAEWRRRYFGRSFHDDRWIDSIAPGVVGRAYLEAVDHALGDIGGRGWRHVSAAAARVRTSARYGGAVWVQPGAGFPGAALSEAAVATPGVRWMSVSLPQERLGDAPMPQAWPGRGDFVIAVGVDEPAGSGDWGDVRAMRRAELGVAWVTAGRWTSGERMPRRDLVLDPFAPLGDAAVAVPHYRPCLGPVGGLTAYLTVAAVLSEAGPAHAIADE